MTAGHTQSSGTAGQVARNRKKEVRGNLSCRLGNDGWQIRTGRRETLLECTKEKMAQFRMGIA
jgi:hypothetical protein